jgi:hypothetical protein
MPSVTFRWRAHVPFAVLAFSAFLLTGCGPTLVPVSGKVTLDNKPLTTGTVTLKPDKEKGNAAKVEPIGKIADDGTYTIETNGQPGAPLGAYKVVIFAQGPPKDPKNPYSELTPLINKKYNQEATTDQNITVVTNPAADAYDLKLTK